MDMAGEIGIEPMTKELTAPRSTAELLTNNKGLEMGIEPTSPDRLPGYVGARPLRYSNHKKMVVMRGIEPLTSAA